VLTRLKAGVRSRPVRALIYVLRAVAGLFVSLLVFVPAVLVLVQAESAVGRYLPDWLGRGLVAAAAGGVWTLTGGLVLPRPRAPGAAVLLCAGCALAWLLTGGADSYGNPYGGLAPLLLAIAGGALGMALIGVWDPRPRRAASTAALTALAAAALCLGEALLVPSFGSSERAYGSEQSREGVEVGLCAVPGTDGAELYLWKAGWDAERLATLARDGEVVVSPSGSDGTRAELVRALEGPALAPVQEAAQGALERLVEREARAGEVPWAATALPVRAARVEAALHLRRL
jgi:hypothetical protein